MAKRVAVIGAGPCGLAQLRAFQSASAKGDEVLHTLVQEDARAALKEAIMALPERKRQCILLYYGRDLSLAEIAEVFNVTPSRISQVLKEARNDLKQTLSGNISVTDLAPVEAS